MAAVTPAQTITDELRRWIVSQAEAGCPPEEMVAAMCRSGWAEAAALQALEDSLRAQLRVVAAERQAAALPAGPMPEPDLANGPSLLMVDGHPVQVLLSMQRPRLVLFGNLLSADECDALVEQARPRLLRSETVDTATGGSEVNTARTSDGMFFTRGESALIEGIERRLATLLRWPVERGEGLQVLHYRPGAEYRPHHDYFDPEQPGSAAVLSRGGQRLATLVIYLSTPAAGGATVFPDVGIDVAPVKGHAVFFSYDRAHPSTRTLHGGAPVLAGEKWVATKWLREGRFE
ncbi:MAG: 2OG-Fe(II) oxygenase [Rubrivivax sp.]|nr:2OG-Fe(II) oxygenase [Rubrivivax sp.]